MTAPASAAGTAPGRTRGERPGAGLRPGRPTGPLGKIGIWLRAHPLGADTVLAVVVLSLSLTFAFTYRSSTHRAPDVWSTLIAIAACSALLWRRRNPGVVLALQIALYFCDAGFDYQVLGGVPLLLGAYAFAAYGPIRLVARVGVVTTAMLGGFIALGWATQDNVAWQDILSSTVIYAGAYLLGDNVRRRRDAAAALLERAERAERERGLLAARLVGEERARLARELHDVVAHSVSLMTIQVSGARRQLRADVERADAALATVEDTGRAAMREMRRVLGVLRSDSGADHRAADASGVAAATSADASRTPQPSMSDLSALVAGSGLPVTLERSPDLGELSPGVELSVYRIVQEAITNIRRHAGVVNRVTVTVARDAPANPAADSAGGSVLVTVADDGRGAAAGGAGPFQPGHGLVGMRERALMYGGAFDAGPVAGGGWRVVARIPVAAA